MTIQGETAPVDVDVSGASESMLPPPPNKYADGEWTPQTVLSTFPFQPPTETTSPLPFLHLVSRLKTTKREGWRRFKIDAGESIADHMYRMSIMTMLCPPELIARGLDVNRATRMALIHDVAESLVGDITPVDNVSKVEKNRREKTTMDYLCGPSSSLLSRYAGGKAGRDMQALWQEYEDSETLEAKFVHDVDKVELLLQTIEYERMGGGEVDLGEFTHVAQRVELPEMQEWCQDLLCEREQFWRSVGKEPSNAETGVGIEKKAQLQEYYGKAEEARKNGELNGR